MGHVPRTHEALGLSLSREREKAGGRKGNMKQASRGIREAGQDMLNRSEETDGKGRHVRRRSIKRHGGAERR